MPHSVSTDTGWSPDEAYRRHRLRVMLAITLGYGFIYTCRLGLSIVKKPLIDNGVFSVEELGMIGAALFYGYAAGKFINGFLADYFSPRLFFSGAIFLAAVVNLLMGFSTLLWLSVALWAINGYVQGMAAPSAVVSIANWFSLKERGRCYGIWNASHSIGEGLTYFAIAWIVSEAGWRYGFVTPGILCIGVAAWCYAFLRDAPQTMGLPSVREWRGDPPSPPSATSTWATQRIIFGIAAIWIVALSSALMYVTRYAINSWGILYLQEVRGYSLTEAGTFLAINTIAGIGGSIAYGFVSDKWFDARRPPANLLFAVIELGALGIIFFGPPNSIVLGIAFAFYGFALSGLMAALGGLFAVDIAPRGATGAAMGFVGIFSYVGAAMQENVTAALIAAPGLDANGVQLYDFDAAILFWIGSSVLSMLLAASLWRAKIRD